MPASRQGQSLGRACVGVRILWAAHAALLTAATPAAASPGHVGESAGVLATLFLAVSLVASLWNVARRRWLVPRFAGNRRAMRTLAILHKELFPSLHGLAGGLALATGLVHGVVEESHPLLWASIAVMGAISLGGLALQFRWGSAASRRRIFILHSQQILTILLAALLIVGHLQV